MHEWKKTYIEFLVVSNRTLRMFTGKVKSLQESLVLHTMKCFIPNVLNDDVNLSFADLIVMFLCRYKHIESSRSYSNHSTQLLVAEMSVNLGGVDFGSLTSHNCKDARSNPVAMDFFNPVEGLSKVLWNRVHDLFRNYQ